MEDVGAKGRRSIPVGGETTKEHRQQSNSCGKTGLDRRRQEPKHKIDARTFLGHIVMEVGVQSFITEVYFYR